MENTKDTLIFDSILNELELKYGPIFNELNISREQLENRLKDLILESITGEKITLYSIYERFKDIFSDQINRDFLEDIIWLKLNNVFKLNNTGSYQSFKNTINNLPTTDLEIIAKLIYTDNMREEQWKCIIKTFNLNVNTDNIIHNDSFCNIQTEEERKAIELVLIQWLIKELQERGYNFDFIKNYQGPIFNWTTPINDLSNQPLLLDNKIIKGWAVNWGSDIKHPSYHIVVAFLPAMTETSFSLRIRADKKCHHEYTPADSNFKSIANPLAIINQDEYDQLETLYIEKISQNQTLYRIDTGKNTPNHKLQIEVLTSNDEDNVYTIPWNKNHKLWKHNNKIDLIIPHGTLLKLEDMETDLVSCDHNWKSTYYPYNYTNTKKVLIKLNTIGTYHLHSTKQKKMRLRIHVLQNLFELKDSTTYTINWDNNSNVWKSSTHYLYPHHLKVGDKLRFLSNDHQHTITLCDSKWNIIEDPTIQNNSLNSNLDVTHLFNKPGLYHFISEPFKDYMKLIVKVGEIVDDIKNNHYLRWNLQENIWYPPHGHKLTINAGDNVTFESTDCLEHNVVFAKPSLSDNKRWEPIVTLDNIKPTIGFKQTITFNDPGIYRLMCESNSDIMRLLIYVNHPSKKYQHFWIKSQNLPYRNFCPLPLGPTGNFVPIGPSGVTGYGGITGPHGENEEIEIVWNLIGINWNNGQGITKIIYKDTIVKFISNDGFYHTIYTSDQNWQNIGVPLSFREAKKNFEFLYKFDVTGINYLICTQHPTIMRLQLIVIDREHIPINQILPKLPLCLNYNHQFLEDFTRWINIDHALKLISVKYLNLRRLSNHQSIVQNSNNELALALKNSKNLVDLISIKTDDHATKLIRMDLGNLLLSKAMKLISRNNEEQVEPDIEFRALSAWYDLDTDYALTALVKSLSDDHSLNDSYLQQLLSERLSTQPHLREKLTNMINKWRSFYS